MSKYTIYVRPQALKEAKRLPGNVRQRVKRVLDDLESAPRPPRGKRLKTTNPALEVWRVKLDDWRVIYSIQEELQQVQVLAIRQRPPYDYGDLDELLKELR